MLKVNTNTLITSGKLKVRGQTQFKLKKFSPELNWYNTKPEIEFMDFLIESTIIRKLRKNELYDLGEDRRFLYLSNIEQLKLVISLLYRGYNVVINDCVELANKENIDKLKELLVKKQAIIDLRNETRKPIREKIAEIGYI
jgi:hypothetical protein